MCVWGVGVQRVCGGGNDCVRCGCVCVWGVGVQRVCGGGNECVGCVCEGAMSVWGLCAYPRPSLTVTAAWLILGFCPRLTSHSTRKNITPSKPSTVNTPKMM